MELASGLVTGGAALPVRTPGGPRQGAALVALELAVLPALLRPPCTVTFSGGVDSSLVLAVATRVARHHRLPDPVPYTWRFPRHPATHESAAQLRVVRALGLRDWVVVVPDEGELDVVGPVARRVLLDHGPRLPVNLHFHEPPIARAQGGSVLTGAGGDQVLSGWLRPENRTPVRRAKNAVPVGLRCRVRRLPARELPWLVRPTASRVLQARLRQRAQEPVLLGDRVRWHAGRRDLTLALQNLGRLGDRHDALVVNPLVDPGFVHALAHEFGHRPAPRRSVLVEELAHGSLPSAVWQPRLKARFGDVFLSAHSRDLAAGWQGEGVDPGLVDRQALRQLWSGWPLPPGTAPLLQQVFFAHHGRARSVPVST